MKTLSPKEIAYYVQEAQNNSVSAQWQSDMETVAASHEKLRAALQTIIALPFDAHEAMMGVPGHETMLGGQDLRVHASMRLIAQEALK